MKTKWLFLKMIWKVLTNKEQGWIFFKMEQSEQESFLQNDKTVVVNIRYLGVDKRVIDKLVDRIEKNPTELYKNRDKRKYEKSKSEGGSQSQGESQL